MWPIAISPGQLGQHIFGENVGYQAHSFDVEEIGVIRGGDARRLLPAMLQRIQGEIGLPRRIGMAVDRDHSAFFAQFVERIGQLPFVVDRSMVHSICASCCVADVVTFPSRHVVRKLRAPALLPTRCADRNPLPDHHAAVDRQLKDIGNGLSQA